MKPGMHYAGGRGAWLGAVGVRAVDHLRCSREPEYVGVSLGGALRPGHASRRCPPSGHFGGVQLILVTGATGMFGSRVLRETVARGGEVRGLVHSEAKIAPVEAAGAEAVVGDLDRPETLPPALDGIERVFLITSVDLKGGARDSAVIESARAAGVHHARCVFLAGPIHTSEPSFLQESSSQRTLTVVGGEIPWRLLTDGALTAQLPVATRGTSTERREALVSCWPSARASELGALPTSADNTKDDQ
jgi:hypothetical protein